MIENADICSGDFPCYSFVDFSHLNFTGIVSDSNGLMYDKMGLPVVAFGVRRRPSPHHKKTRKSGFVIHATFFGHCATAETRP